MDDNQFFVHTRMHQNTFNTLINLLHPYMNTAISSKINIEHRLALTLLYMSQGTSIQSLAWSWKLGKETVRQIILENSEAIWSAIGPLYVAEPSKKDYLDIAKDFWSMWNLPNCIGAIDGKHIALATCDAQYIFTHIDVGAYGLQSDGGIFNISNLGKKICTGQLDVPPEQNLPGSSVKLPHFFVGDAAFTLTKNLMKPYPGLNLPHNKELYNKRLSRARRDIENAFGILVNRWRILLTTLYMIPSNAEKIILACIALHNFLRLNKESSQLYMPSSYVDWEDQDHNIHDGAWRNDGQGILRSINPSQHIHSIGRKNALNCASLLTMKEG